MSDTAAEKSAQAPGHEAAAPGTAPAGTPAEDTVVLSLGDLLPDSHGNIVLLNDAGILSMAVVSDKPVVDTGVAEHHVTADGTDVAGMAYYSFEAGPTLYVPADMHFSLLPTIG